MTVQRTSYCISERYEDYNSADKRHAELQRTRIKGKNMFIYSHFASKATIIFASSQTIEFTVNIYKNHTIGSMLKQIV